ncbi:MAG: hypothetical protein IJ658_01220 [Kiritimatiellae bacterium]|nr:hypothetical protein [Kiritimatiellia bacterium]
MRKPRLIETCRCYHLTSRLAHRAFFLTEEERTLAIGLLRRVEEFSGVIVLAYVFMTNHFHVFIYVPEAEEIGEVEILRRIKILYRDASLGVVLSEWRRLKEEEARELAAGVLRNGRMSRFAQYKASFLKRMWNSAEFMRTFKQHFTMSYNGRRDHHGTMWEGRYSDRSHAPEATVMWKTAAYIDANPVHAGIVGRPDGYRWCSFAAACHGDEKARRGYAFIYGDSDGWDSVREKHEVSIREALADLAAKRLKGAGDKEGGGVRNFVSRSDPQLAEPKKFPFELRRGDPDVAWRILELLESGPMAPGALREAVGIKSRIHFSRYYIAPLLEHGLVRRSMPELPNSPRQMYMKG